MQSKAYIPVWSEKFAVRSFDIGLNRMMCVSRLCGYFQEVAGKHATHLDVGYKFVQQSGKVWLLSRLYIRIKELPGWGQEFELQTWPLGNERIFYRRDYKVNIGTDTVITAISYWILLDLKTRRPTVMPIHEDVLKANDGLHSMTMPSHDFPTVSSGETDVRQVNYSDLDQNRHVNNARYVEWIFDLFDLDLLEKNIPSFFAIEYKQEVKAGDEVTLIKNKIEDSPLTLAVEGRLSATNQVCVRSKVVFN